MREKMIQAFFDVATDENLFPEENEMFKNMYEKINNATNDAKFAEEVLSLLATFQHTVFFNACNAMLDFISGKDTCVVDKSSGEKSN